MERLGYGQAKDQEDSKNESALSSYFKQSQAREVQDDQSQNQGNKYSQGNLPKRGYKFTKRYTNEDKNEEQKSQRGGHGSQSQTHQRGRGGLNTFRGSTNSSRGGANNRGGSYSVQRGDYMVEESKNFRNQYLKEILELQPEALVENIHQSYPDIVASINETYFSIETYQLYIRILYKLAQEKNVKLSEFRDKIFSAFIQSDFLQNLSQTFLPSVATAIQSHQFLSEILGDLQKLIETFSILIEKFRSSSDKFPILILSNFIEDDLPGIVSFHDNGLRKNEKLLQKLVKSFQEFQEKKNIVSKQYFQEQKEKNKNQVISGNRREAEEKRKNEEHKLLPPDDFTKMSIVPSLHELKEQEFFLRAMPDKGGRFRNSKDYLDLIFRLLREDAILPFRQAMKFLDKQKELNSQQLERELKQANCKMFSHSEIIDIVISKQSENLNLRLRIHEGKGGSVNWATSKRLLNGSLILISSDGFKSAYFCIVQTRQQDEMAYTSRNFGYIQIDISLILPYQDEVEADQILEFFTENKDKNFQVIESQAYFEAYHHVLKKLQVMAEWKKLPLEQYLLGTETKYINEPKLLQEKQQGIRYIYPNYDDSDDDYGYDYDYDPDPEMIDDNNYYGFIQNFNDGVAKALLDVTQTQAIRQCFYKEFALIQGPPGTGKTYVGETFVRVMLQSKVHWREKKGPILLVCYTNHALDQFLRLISKETQNFLRLGARCKDSDLVKHHIREYIKDKGIQSPMGYGSAKKDLHQIIQKINSKKGAFILQNIGIVNSLTHQGDSEYKKLGDKIKLTTKQKILSQISEKYERERRDDPFLSKDLYNESLNHIEMMFKKDNDIAFVFWLGIVDSFKYIEQIWEKFLQGQIDQDIEDANFDDKDQRENEGQEADMDDDLEVPILLYQVELSQAEREILQKIDVLTKNFNPQTINDKFFKGAQSFQQCINIGKQQPPSKIYFQNPQDLGYEERWKFNNWLYSYRNIYSETDSLKDLISEFQDLNKRIKEMELLTYIKAIKNADVVAMTTTGCAKYNSILKNQNFSIVIVEEAAEVFEAHILTSLSEETEHVILIGDHQQLRPNPASYEMAQKYNLSLSMFERLVNNNFQYVTLQNQRRMRPEIANMMRLIYPQLKDDEKVQKYEKVRGMSTNVFFFDHNEEEQHEEGMMSKKNKFEAEMIIKLTFYLIQQNYYPNEITILSLYLAQSTYIKNEIRRYPKDAPIQKVKVMTVDNYQGEENEIILLSLVRSNQKNDIGYLKVNNRVCVALSRAKKGLFIFGNASCLYQYSNAQNQKSGTNLKDQSNLWQQVLEYLAKNNFIGRSLKFQCENHNIVTEVTKPSDFQKMPEGGCQLVCGARLDCGHSCTSLCHVIKSEDPKFKSHQGYKCLKNCERDHPCGHQCQNQCFKCEKELQKCLKQVEQFNLRCGHTQKLACNEIAEGKCKHDCTRILECGHQCSLKCYQICNTKKCGQYIPKTLPCGHQMDIKCHISVQDFLDSDLHGCRKPCGAKLDCGHSCKEECGTCQKKPFHPICQEKIDKALQCGHVNDQKCGSYSVLCKQKCKTSCIHSKCRKLCFEPCALCTEKCQIYCVHQQCKLRCKDPCDKKQCYEPCLQRIQCGHQCLGLCGDKCIQICRICKPDDEVFEIFFGYEDDPNSRFVKIDCGHIFESKSLDQMIQTKKDVGLVQFPECPKCKQPIKNTLRYQNQINQTLIDMNQIKALNLIQYNKASEGFEKMDTQYIQLQQKLNQLQFQHHQQLKEVFDAWQKLYQNALQDDNESKLRNCNIKLELISFMMAFALFMKAFDEGSIKYSQENNELYSFSRVSFAKILSLKFVVPSLIKDDMKLRAQKCENSCNLKATVEMIVEALQMGQGHFYKCPNGHLYVIGDCGGAMEESKCNECGAVIGGGDHTLTTGNQHSDIDGSLYSAWDPSGFNHRVLNGEINLQDFIHD